MALVVRREIVRGSGFLLGVELGYFTFVMSHVFWGCYRDF
jgi:hypothetical protein